MTPAIRPGEDADADEIIRLIGDAWAEYPGCVLDVDGELPELRALASWFSAAGGALWVAGDEADLQGMIAARPGPGDDGWEICRLYVAKSARSTGLAHALLDLAEARARAAGAGTIVLWTDTRFHRAHSFYEKRGYLRQGPIRVLTDLSRSLEFRYAKPARGIVAACLDAAAAASAGRSLARLLAAAGSAEVQPARAAETWRDAAARVGQGRCLIIIAWQDGEIAGAVQLDLDAAGAQPHRAAMKNLVLDLGADRQGVAAALLTQLDAAAAARGVRLVTGEVPAGEAPLLLGDAQGWQTAGRIPDPDGEPGRETVIVWRRIGAGPGEVRDVG